MIIRALRLRHGRIALPKPLHAVRWPRRFYSIEPPRATGSVAEEPTAQVTNPFAKGQTSASSSNDGGSQQPETQHFELDLRNPNHPVAREWAFYQQHRTATDPIGSHIEPHYKPYELLSNPPSPRDITLELLMASQSHLGHATSLWNPANARYIFGIREGVHIISLDATASYLRRACKIVHGVAARGGLILFVGTREGQVRAVVRAAALAGGCHLFDKWTPGSITNGQQILGKCRKRAVNELDEDVPGFEQQLENTAALKPDLVVCLNPLENYVLLHECGLNNIPTIGIIDTDANPTWVTYPIPANDDSLRCVQVIAGVLGRAGQEGQAERLLRAQSGFPQTSTNNHGLEAPDKGSNNTGDGVERVEAEREQELMKTALAEASEKLVAYKHYSESDGLQKAIEPLETLPLDDALEWLLQDHEQSVQAATESEIEEVLKKHGVAASKAKKMKGISARELNMWQKGRKDPKLDAVLEKRMGR